jgi:hypothetical protein
MHDEPTPSDDHSRRDPLWLYDVGLSGVAVVATGLAFLLTESVATTAITFVLTTIVVLVMQVRIGAEVQAVSGHGGG